jgi:hypothetical protein
MGARGRHGVAELAVIGPGGIETVRRPEPPDELTTMPPLGRSTAPLGLQTFRRTTCRLVPNDR